jgi:hypothetical protein
MKKPKLPQNFDNIIKIAESSSQRLRSISSLRRAYKVPDWYNKITPSAGHGAGVIQKRAWRVVSEYVRKRDFSRYGGKCISCETILARWEDGQACHFLPYTLCNAIYKFDPENIFLGCSTCNRNFAKNNAVGYRMADEMRRRTNEPNIVELIEYTNLQYHGQKLEAWHLVELVARLAPHLVKE